VRERERERGRERECVCVKKATKTKWRFICEAIPVEFFRGKDFCTFVRSDVIYDLIPISFHLVLSFHQRGCKTLKGNVKF
jgi:hypothetical protein